MKKKAIYLSLIILIFSIISSTVVLATIASYEQQPTILNGQKLNSIEDTYTEINNDIMTLTSNSNQEVITKANEYMEDLKIDNVIFTTDNSEVKNYNNALESRIETVVTNENAIVRLNSETNELVTYISNKTDFDKGEFSEEEIKEKAISIFNSIEDVNKDNYEMIYIEQFDDEIWRVGFAKKYDELINKGESINFSFCPANNEIVTLAINRIGYSNNNVELAENEAREIAKSYLDKSEANNMTIELEIVRPNYFYNELKGDESVYVKINECRKAYVARFNNESASEVYIDATTGEVIGGNMILGGEY